MKKLTKRQKQILKFIDRYIKKHGRSPTSQEIGDHYGIFPNGAWVHVNALEKKGAISQVKGKMRSITVNDGFL